MSSKHSTDRAVNILTTMGRFHLILWLPGIAACLNVLSFGKPGRRFGMKIEFEIITARRFSDSFTPAAFFPGANMIVAFCMITPE
jgi:hypothetical protein